MDGENEHRALDQDFLTVTTRDGDEFIVMKKERFNSLLKQRKEEYVHADAFHAHLARVFTLDDLPF